MLICAYCGLWLCSCDFTAVISKGWKTMLRVLLMHLSFVPSFGKTGETEVKPLKHAPYHQEMCSPLQLALFDAKCLQCLIILKIPEVLSL